MAKHEVEIRITQNPNAHKVKTAKEIGLLIRRRRNELGYTQSDIAAFMGCSQRLISEIENGRGSVGVQKILDLATGLGLDLTITARGGN